MERLNALMQQLLLPSDPATAEKTLELTDRMLSVCNVWVIRCNISEEAAIIAYGTIIGEI